MDPLPVVWLIILSYLPLNDLIEVNAVCKMIDQLSRKDKLFIRKLFQNIV